MPNGIQNLSVSLTSIPTLPLVELSKMHSELDLERRQRDVNKSMNLKSESNSFAHPPLELIEQTQLEHDTQQSQQDISLNGDHSLPMLDARNKTDVAPLEKYSLEWFTSKLDGNAPRNTISATDK